MYPIKTVASLTGLGTETIRAWERRYQAILPKRNVNGRRYYSQQDRDRLTLLAHLTREGHNIGKIATLSDAQLQDLLNRSQQKQSLPLHFSEQIIKALSHYQIQHCEQLLKKALIANEPFSYVTDILAPTLKLVGILCHEKKLTVGQEHMFSALVKRILLSMINNLQSYSVNRSGILLATPSGESHDFGILMCSLLAAEQHLNIYFLGADTPAKDILQAAKELNCEIVLLSLTEYSLEAVTVREMEKIIAGSACENLRIWLVGEGIYGWLEHQEDIPDNLELIDSLETFYSKAMRTRA